MRQFCQVPQVSGLQEIYRTEISPSGKCLLVVWVNREIWSERLRAFPQMCRVLGLRDPRTVLELHFPIIG